MIFLLNMIVLCKQNEVAGNSCSSFGKKLLFPLKQKMFIFLIVFSLPVKMN